MADAKKPAAAPKPGKKSGGGKLQRLTMMAVAAIAIPFVFPTFILLLAAFIPTYVALMTDSDPEKSGATSVGAMNAAGAVPFVIDLWEKGQTLPNALQILTSANDWLVILGAAAIGQLIVYAIPQAIATLTIAQSELRVKGLRKNLDTLQESWGPDVATAKPVDSLVQG
jgi:hypothetical protein